MIPKKYGPMLFSLILSGLMSLLVSGIATFRAVGLSSELFDLWTSAWLTAWLVAFPVVMLVAPFTQKLVRSLLAEC
ncbi:DUF2798 domain-containing protein [Herminiimonas aquatilis]|uniref:DUF2798 domain-containing protein n=1 Tax=Herminiimonas aquatilis TaxID=345342 RepID=A0ABW2J8W3_9BURK